MGQFARKAYNGKVDGTSRNFKRVFFEKYQTARTTITADKNENVSPPNAAGRVKLLTLGRISPENPTVSDILLNHPRYGKNCWKIVHSRQNREKPFNNIRPGTRIFLNPKTFEISWKGGPKTPEADVRQTIDGPKHPFGDRLKGRVDNAGRTYFLGNISKANPTVSSLLRNHPDYQKKCWQIIHANQNSEKPFEKMVPGTAVYIHSKTQEISWEEKPNAVLRAAFSNSLPYPASNQSLPTGSRALSDRLEMSVRSHLGKSYADLNCYELVIQGLKHAGVRYSGKNGLKAKLVQMAKNRGLPVNSYLTGEGIVKTAGYEVFSKRFPKIGDPKKATSALIKQIAPFLDNGLILSFSTPSRGHMGVVSNNKDMWTFINSGNLDNQFDERHTTKGVGEEVLASEIYNWLRLASKRNESLQITLGKLSRERLTAQNLEVSDTLG